VDGNDGKLSVGMPLPFLIAFFENVFCDLDLRTHDLENIISLCP